MVTDHPIRMGGLALAGSASRAQVVVCPPTEPIERLFSAISDAAEGGALSLARPKRTGSGASAALKLFQPVHRVLHFVLLDLFCEVPGKPRLDPRKVESAGVVVRRLRTVQRRESAFERYQDSGGRYRSRRSWVTRREVVRERWVVEKGRVLGWQTLADPTEDPDPKKRTGQSTGVVALDQALALRRARRSQAKWEERAGSLFVAPPEVCTAVGRTVVYGLLPTASSEVTDPAPTTYDAELVDGILSPWLKEGSWRLAPWPAQTVTAADVQDPTTGAYSSLVSAEDASDWLDMLQQVRFLLGGFDDNTIAAELRAVLGGLQVLHADWSTGSVLDFIEEASDALIGGAVDNLGNLVEITHPIFWPEIDAPTAARIAEIAGRLLVQRSGQTTPEGRFEDQEATYVAIPFARVKAEDGCPPRLIWGPETEPFRIAPWFEGSEDAAPLARIQLPDITRDSVRQLAPNVSFLLPPSVKAFLDANNPKDLLAGDVKAGDGGLGIQFICSFNIPIITLCAFILLWVIIFLLNIVFWWLPFIMICLPFPKKE
jgi:hypothetical protein